MSTISVPRPQQGRRRAFVFEGSGDVNPWASDVDRTLDQIIHSLGQAQRLFAQLTNQTSAAVGKVALHGSTHLPHGTDPLATAAPSGGYGSTSLVGTGNAFLRSDARFRFPQALKSIVGGLAELTLSDDGAGSLFLDAPASAASLSFRAQLPGASFSIQPGVSFINLVDLGAGDVGGGDLGFDLDGGYGAFTSGSGFSFAVGTFNAISQNRGSGDSVITVEIDHSHTNERYGMDCVVFNNSPTLAAKKIGVWNATLPGLTGVWTGATEIVVYDTTAFTITPSATSGTALKAYGGRFFAPSALGTNGGFTETAAAIFKAASNASSTVTLGAGIIVEQPQTSTTTQVAIEVKPNVAGGATPTDRIAMRIGAIARGTNRYGVQVLADSTGTPTNDYGMDVAARSVGTNRWSYRGADKIENTATDIIASASAKGFIVKCSDDTTQYVRIRAFYNGGSPSVTLDSVGTTLPTN